MELVKVKRQGSVGDVFGQMVTDPLITAIEAATARGKYEIGKSGSWKKESIELPLFAEGDLPGLLEVGSLVEITERGAAWRGQVAAVSVSAQPGWRVTQKVEIERYMGN